MNIIAIDLGKFNSMVCFYDSDTRKHSFANATTEKSYFRSLLTNHLVDLVVVEACGPSGWVNDLCLELKIPAIVCSTHEEAWLFKNVKRKTDKDDALKLARMASLGHLKATHVPNTEMREQRRLITYRKKIVNRINRNKNTIRAIFSNQGQQISGGAKTWHTGREYLIENAKPYADCSLNELWRGELDLELIQLQHLEDQLKTIESKLDQFAKTDKRTLRVMTINGVGRVTAEAIVAYIDDPHRFKNANQVGAYAGLVPSQYQSGKTDRRGRITKRGPRLLRTLLVECAWCSLQYNPWSRETYDRIHGGKQSRKKKAAVAIARKILILAWALMRDDVDYDPERNRHSIENEKTTAVI
jgi:transposase